MTRILTDNTGKKATGVVFAKTSGEEFEQPADLVLVRAFGVFSLQLLMVASIGQIYDPVSQKGTLGRNFSHQTLSTATALFDPKTHVVNPFIAAASICMCIDEFNGDIFDHGSLGFVGCGYMGQVQTNGPPIDTTPAPL